MNADERCQLEHADITGKVIGAFYSVYKELGIGFLESVYANAMAVMLREQGLRVDQEFPIQVCFHGTVIGEFRTDLLVKDAVICELKVAETISPKHVAQLLNYLRATRIEVGLILNFGPEPEKRRYVFRNTRKQSLPNSVNPR